jgi:S1-C subfamily serine protease
MEIRSTKWIVLLLLAVTLLGCSLPGALAELLAPTPTPVHTAVPTPTVAPLPTTPVADAPPSVPDTQVAPPATMLALEEQIVQVNESIGQAVVNITNRSYAYDFFYRPVPQEGTGSGFMYDREGHIITNYHVIENADELYVTLPDETTVSAVVVGADPSNDLAVLKIEVAPELLHPVPLGESENLRVGQFVVAIGNPFGFERTLTVGVVSALGRVIESPDDQFIGEIIQTDAAIIPGNSGGPLLDLSGRLIGVNTAIVSPSQASAGIGFAVPADTVRRVVPELIARGYYPHPWLGIRYLWSLNPERKEILEDAGMSVPVDEGVLIIETTPSGPADRAGLLGGQQQVRIGRFILPIGGDLVTAIDGEPITSERDLDLYLDTRTDVGQTVQVTLWRDDQELTVPVVLAEKPH